MMEETELGMLFSFPDQSDSFVHGFEAGSIWQEIDGEGKPEVDRGFDNGLPVHTENIALIQRMAEVRGYKLETKPTGMVEWTGIKLTFVGTGRAKPVLSVVGTGT